METALLEVFNRGLDVVSGPGQLQQGFTQDAINMTGFGNGVQKRLGAESMGPLTATGSYIYWSESENRLYSFEGDSLYSYLVSSDTFVSRTLVHAFTGGGNLYLADFLDDVVGVHTIDGVFTVTGDTYALKTAAVVGNVLAVWQNKVWVTGNGGVRVYWSNAGTAATWTTATDFVDIREMDDTENIGIGSGNGMDVVGRTGLLVWKSNSVYRINDSETGAYTTVDGYHGAGGRDAMTSYAGVIYVCNRSGVYVVTEDGLRLISVSIDPLWADNAGFASSGNWHAWFAWGRVYFTRSSIGGGVSPFIYEYVPETEGWWVHSLNDGGTARGVIYVTVTPATGGAQTAGAYILDSGGTKMLRMWKTQQEVTTFSIATKDYVSAFNGTGGTNVSARYLTPWLPFALDKVRVRRCIIDGWSAAATFAVAKDFSTTTEARAALTVTGDPGFTELHSLGVMRAISLDIRSAGSGSNQIVMAPTGVTRFTSETHINAIRFDYINLGRA
jgi:hypothetical protein